MVSPGWRLATVLCVILLAAILLTSTTLAIVTARDAMMLKHAVGMAYGSDAATATYTPTDLTVPALPTLSTSTSTSLNIPFARFAAELVARLEYWSPLDANANAPPSLTHLGTFSSDSGKNNGWLLSDSSNTNTTLWLVFRGTSTNDEWKKDFQLQQVSFLTRLASRSIGRLAYPDFMVAPISTNTDLFDPDIGVHSGFMDIYMSLRPALLNVLSNFPTSIKRICITGHSLGASQALCATLDLSTLFPDVTLDTVVFGCPRVGNNAFADALLRASTVNSLVLLANTCDMVTNMPLAVQPNLSPPYDPLIYTHPGPAIHNFTENRLGWIANHMISVYIDHLSQTN